MAINLRTSPYNDRFDPRKDRVKLLFNPDRPLQQAELNEMQSIIEYYQKNFGDSIFKDGDIQSGLNFTLTQDNVLTLNPGYVYIGGRIRYYDGDDSIQLSGVGKETIGLKLTQTIITPDEDSSLLDQTNGVPSYFSKGADRLEEKLSIALNDPSSAPLHVFQDGKLYIRSVNPEAEKIHNILAERTYDESGSYKVEGFNIFSEERPEDKGKDTVPVVIDAGKAYVEGFKVDKPTSTRISVPKSTATKKGTNESTVFNKSDNKIILANAPVKSVDRVSGQVLVTKEEVGRASAGDSADYLKNNTAFEVVKVWTESSPGNTLKEYKQGQDYVLTNGQEINWSPQGQEPQGGTSYYVSYKYTRTMREGTDYKVVNVNEGEGVLERTYLDFNLEGVKPIDQSVILVDYTYYLARKDVLMLNKYGDITRLEGEPDILRMAVAPQQTDPLNLKLGIVTVLPNSDEAYCEEDSVKRLSMSELQKLKTRLENVEYNQAVNALDQDAMEGQDPLTLRSVFSEGFISLDKADITNSNFGVSFSFEDAEATLQFTTAVNEPSIDESKTNAHIWGRLVSAPFTEERALFQSQASETMNVNPYNIPNKQGVLKITPSEDNWIDEERITVTDQKTKTMTVNRWWRHLDDPNRFGANEQAAFNNIKLDEGQSWGNQGLTPGAAYRHDTKYGRTGTMLEAGGTRTLEEAIEFIRVRDINFTVTGLHPNADNLYVLFDGIRCPIVPHTDRGFTKGSESGTIRTNAKGRAEGHFTIPAGVRCGTREVTIRNDESVASTSYSAHGRKKTVQDVIIRTRVTINLVDPLAQSFQFLDNRTISSLGLYFASKGDKNSNVTIQIREMGDQGFPTKVICAETVLNAEDIKISNDASAETRVYFDDPMMAQAGKEYAIVVITENDEYTMWIGTRTQPKIDKPKETISGNPYLEGVLFSSSNASTWSVHQNSDMKFGVYTSRYEENGTIEFDPIENVEADRVVLMSSYLTPENTGCFWEAKIIFEDMDEGVTFDMLTWQPIGNYQDIDLGAKARQIKLRATFKSNRYISPLLSSSDLTFTTFLTELTGSYVGRAIDMSEAPYNTIRISYEAFLPQGTKVTPKYSTDNGSTWKTFTKSPDVRRANTEFYRYVIEEKVKSSGTYDNFKVRLDLETQNSFLRPRIRRLMCTMRDE